LHVIENFFFLTLTIGKSIADSADIPKLSHYCADHLSIIYSILSHRYTKLIGFD